MSLLTLQLKLWRGFGKIFSLSVLLYLRIWYNTGSNFNFFPKGKSINIPSEDSNVIIDDFPFNKEQRRSSGLILNTEAQYRNLPSDELYGIQGNNYKKNDKFIYNKKEKKISNSLLLYINYFYKKAKYYKFFVRNANEQSISLKQQNYQCFKR